MTYRKADIDTHNDGGIGGPQYPAVNVKTRHWPDADLVRRTFECSENRAEWASQAAYDMHAESFWESAGDDAEYMLGPCKVYSAGRSGGWLIVEGLPPIESWDAIMVAKWGRFERAMHAEVEYLCSDEAIVDSIRANEWALDADAITAMMVAV